MDFFSLLTKNSGDKMKGLFFFIVSFLFLIASNINTNGQVLFVKEVKFSGMDTLDAKIPNWVRVMPDSELFQANFESLGENEKAIFADSIIFLRYGWESTILGYMHSEKTSLSLKFGATQIGVTWDFLFSAMRRSFVYIKHMMKKQESAAAEGNPNYEFVQ